MPKPAKSQVSEGFVFFVEYRRYLVIVIMLITAGMAWNVKEFRVDPTFKSLFAQNCPLHREYQTYLQEFGEDESILVAIRNDSGILQPEFLQALETIAQGLLKIQSIKDVVSVANLKVFAKRDGLVGAYDLVPKENGTFNTPDMKDLEINRKVFPATNFLLSGDLKTAGLAIRLVDDWPATTRMGEMLQAIEGVVDKDLPRGSEYRMVGSPVLKQGILRYSVTTGAVFFVLGIMVCLVISLYIFKSGRVAAISALVSGLGVFWAIGLMSVLGIELNTATSLAFGLYVFVTMATVIHVATHYFEQYQLVGDRVEAAKNALRAVGSPCLMCALTTAVGFASIMISRTPIIIQLGLIMSVGVMLCFALAISLTPALLIAVKPVAPRKYDQMSRDVVSRAVRQLQNVVLTHSKVCVVCTLVVVGSMIAAIPFIKVNTQILNILSDSSKEIRDLRFIEANLVGVHAVELVVDGDQQVFKQPHVWRKVAELHSRLEDLPQVSAVDSLPPLLEHLYTLWSPPGSSSDAAFTNPKFVPQILAMMSLSGEGQELLKRYVNKGLSRMHLSVRIRNPKGTPILDTIDAINAIAASTMTGIGKTFVTGELAMYAFQAADFAWSQISSLIIAVIVIAILMVIQLRSWVLGLLSLIPNLVPLFVIFGVMGWLKIPLDQVTTLVASVSLGMSVDNTIHYLTHFGRAAGANRDQDDIKAFIVEANTRTGRALISTATVLSVGMLLLMTSPFQPVAYFGFLTACAITSALLADMVFMPALMLVVPQIRKAFTTEA